MHIERELKFRLPPDAKSRLWLLLPGPPVCERRRLHSTYYDTPDFRLRDAGAALRVRRDGRRRVICFKCESPGAHGIPQRREWEAAAADGKFSPELLPYEEIRAATDIDLWRLRAAMVPVFSTRFVRCSAEVSPRAGTRVLVCLDTGAITAGRLRDPLLELELELLAGSARSMLTLAEDLVEPLRLELDGRSKAERGYRMVEGRPGRPLKARSLQLERGVSAETTMLAVLSNCRDQVLGNLFGTTHSHNPEFLHQLRVGLRRLRSALRTFGPLVSERRLRPLARELKGLVSQLGNARDWDVFCATLSQRSASLAGPAPEALRLLKRARAKRNAALKHARDTLGSPAFHRFLLHLMHWMEDAAGHKRGARRAPWRPAVQFGRRALARQERKAVRRADGIKWSDPRARHRLRIVVKRLRYACEFFSELLPKKSTRRYLVRLEAVQDVLGELNDIAVGRNLLREVERGADDAEVAMVRDLMQARERLLVKRLGAVWREWRKEAQFG